MNPINIIQKEMVKDKMALDVKTMPTEEVVMRLTDILENHYKDIPYRDLIAVNKAMLMIRGVKFKI